MVINRNVDPQRIYELITTSPDLGWNLNQPKLIVSVTGGARYFNAKLLLTKAFQKGLMKVAETTGSLWLKA